MCLETLETNVVYDTLDMWTLNIYKYMNIWLYGYMNLWLPCSRKVIIN